MLSSSYCGSGVIESCASYFNRTLTLPSYSLLSNWSYGIEKGYNNFYFGNYPVSKGSFLGISFVYGSSISLTTSDVPLYADYIWQLNTKPLKRNYIPNSRFLINAYTEDSYFYLNTDLSFSFPIDDMYKVYFLNYTIINTNFSYSKAYIFRKLVFIYLVIYLSLKKNFNFQFRFLKLHL